MKYAALAGGKTILAGKTRFLQTFGGQIAQVPRKFCGGKRFLLLERGNSCELEEGSGDLRLSGREGHGKD